MICSLCGECIDPDDDSCYCDKLKKVNQKIGNRDYPYIVNKDNPPTSSNIIHPSYYGWIPKIECMDVVKHFDFILGNVIKYCWRCGLKSSTTKLEDLEKAKYYIEIAIEMEKEKCNSGT